MVGDTVNTTCDITKLLCELCLHPIISESVNQEGSGALYFKNTYFRAMIQVRILSRDRRLMG